jgi:hypothetical protein
MATAAALVAPAEDRPARPATDRTAARPPRCQLLPLALRQGTGRKRHLRVDSLGWLWAVVGMPARVQDDEGAQWVFDQLGRRLPRLTIYAASL